MKTTYGLAIAWLLAGLVGCKGPELGQRFGSLESVTESLPTYEDAPAETAPLIEIADRSATRNSLDQSAEPVREVSQVIPVPAGDFADADTDEGSVARLGELAPEAGGIVPDQPIDLATALQLAGGQSWTIQLAREQTRQAQARHAAAQAAWLPSLNLGIAWTKHDGQLQATDGTVSDISRNSCSLAVEA